MFCLGLCKTDLRGAISKKGGPGDDDVHNVLVESVLFTEEQKGMQGSLHPIRLPQLSTQD